MHHSCIIFVVSVSVFLDPGYTPLQALEAAPRVARAASDSILRRPSLTGVEAGGTRSGDTRPTGPMESVAQTLYSIRAVGKNLTPKKIRENLEAVRTETANVVNRFVCASERGCISWCWIA